MVQSVRQAVAYYNAHPEVLIAPIPGITNPTTPTNLKLDFDILHKDDGAELEAGKATLGPPIVLDLRTKVKAEKSDAAKWMEKGKRTVEVDTEYRLGNGPWTRVDRSHIDVQKLKEGESVSVHHTFTVPTDSTIATISFRAVIDPTHEVTESKEGDNTSRTETFLYDKNLYAGCNIVPVYIAQDGSRSINQNDEYHLIADIQNIGSTDCANDFRIAYRVMLPGESTWATVATDGVSHKDIPHGVSLHRERINDGIKATTLGTYRTALVVDINNNNPETNEDDNIKEGESFTVNPTGPDLAITSIATDTSVINQGGTVQATITVTNAGNRESPTSKTGWYVWKPGGSSWIRLGNSDAPKLNPGAVITQAYTYSNVFDIPGVYQLRAAANHDPAFNEIGRDNNIGPSIAITVKPALAKIGVLSLRLKEGSSVKKGKYIHPICTLGNQGISSLHPKFRINYTVEGATRDGDDVGANEVCLGCQHTEEVKGDSIKMTNTGNSYVVGCCIPPIPGTQNTETICATVPLRVTK